MRKALYFDNAPAFCDFVRVRGADAKPPRDGAFELCRVVHPARPGESALVLFHCRETRRSAGLAVGIRAELDTGNDNLLRWNHNESDGETPVIERARGTTLLEFVEIHPWKQNGGDREPDGPVLFWIHENREEENLLPILIRDSLRLGNDRIQFGSLISGDEEKSETLLRIEKPSYFLIQRCLEEFSGSVELFYSADEDLFVRWGFEHPMADWWRRSDQGRSGDWLFFRGGSEYVHVNPPIWRDAYDLTEIALDFPHREIWAESPGSPPRFKVPLSLERKLSNTEPELWLLDEAGVRQLEETLQITDDESLRAWQIAVQRLDGDSGAGGSKNEWVFVRETRAGSKRRRHHDFAGTGFARYQGLNNLFLPVGFELEPPLRRDAYRSLFSLEPETLTIVIPAEAFPGEIESDEFRILRVKEKAFDLLISFVDYIVERDAEILSGLLENSLFDFREYLKAPKHPGLTPGKTAESASKQKGATADLEEFAKTGAEVAGDLERSDSNALVDRLEIEAEEIDESQLDERQRRELQLERDLISSGQSLDLWCDLLVSKNQLGRSADAVLCAIEALWLAEGTQREEAIRTSLVTLAEASLDSGQDPAAVTAGDPEWTRRAATFALVNRKPDDRESLDGWIGEMTAFLREHDSGLRSKERWLAWGEILKSNHDLRRETQVREEIRNRITDRGLGLEETPAFLRSRIFLDRNFFGAGKDGKAEGSGAVTALANLGELRSAGLAFETPRLRLAARAILARAYSSVGDIVQAQELIEGSAAAPAEDFCAEAWETLFQIEALREIDASRAEALEQKLESRVGRADPETARAIRELRETYNQRAKADNPAAFLARENRGRTYPSGDGTETGVLYELSMQLEQHVGDGNEPSAVQVMRNMMTLDEVAEYDDFVKLPQFVETLVAGMERFKWGERGATLIPVFENFCDRAPGFISQHGNDFYGAILRSNLALGLLAVENLDKAVRQIEVATETVARNTIELDFIDSAAALIRTIEQLPLSHRAPFLQRLITGVASQFDSEQSPYVSNERLFAVLARLIDQMAEAAASKDRLSLQQFRHYQLQDEFLILQRIQSESFCEQ